VRQWVAVQAAVVVCGSAVRQRVAVHAAVCSRAAVRQCAAVCGSARQYINFGNITSRIINQRARRWKGDAVHSVLPTPPPCIVIYQQQGAVKGGMLIALMYHELVRRSRSGGAVLQTSLCTINQRGAELHKQRRGTPCRMDIYSKRGGTQGEGYLWLLRHIIILLVYQIGYINGKLFSPYPRVSAPQPRVMSPQLNKLLPIVYLRHCHMYENFILLAAALPLLTMLAFCR
jgi:hypothetical protein